MVTTRVVYQTPGGMNTYTEIRTVYSPNTRGGGENTNVTQDGMDDVEVQNNQNNVNVHDFNQDENNMGDVDYGFNFNNNNR